MVLANLSRLAPPIKIKMERCATPNATLAIMGLAPSAGHPVPEDSVTTEPSAPSPVPMEEELARSGRSTTLRSVSVFGILDAMTASTPPDATSAHLTAPLA